MQHVELSYLTKDSATLQRELDTLELLSPGLQQTEVESAGFFAHSLDFLCVATMDGNFKRLNPAWTTHLGWTLEELMSGPFLDFVHPDDHAATLAEIEKLAAGYTTTLFENRYRHRDGSYRWLQWNAWPTAGNKKICAIARDVTHPKRLEQEIFDITDKERARLGRELHDGLCQNLAGIAALSTTLSKTLAADSLSAASAQAAEICKLLNEAISEARNLARGLGPVGLTEAGLVGALKLLCLNVQHLFRVTCTLEFDPPLFKLCRELEKHLFRISQEAVNNAITHGRANRIEIRLRYKNGQGLLSIRDDGKGLPEDGNFYGMGLNTMTYRAHLIGASFEIHRRRRRGATVICAFPLRTSATTGEHPGP